MEQPTTGEGPFSSPVFRQVVLWTSLVFATVFFVIPRVSPYEGLNETLNSLNVFRRLSEWLVGKTEDLFDEYGYYLVFFGVLLENTMFLGLLVPGQVILILAGLSAENGSISLWLVMPLAVVATIVGDTISYLFGRLGWARVLERGSMGQALERMRAPVESNSSWLIFAYHFSAYSRVVGPVAAGLFHIPYRKWAPLDYIGGTVWVLVFTGIGVGLGLAGVEFGDTKRVVQILELGIFVLLVVAVVLTVWKFNRDRDRAAAEAGAAPGLHHPRTVIVPVEDDEP